MGAVHVQRFGHRRDCPTPFDGVGETASVSATIVRAFRAK